MNATQRSIVAFIGLALAALSIGAGYLALHLGIHTQSATAILPFVAFIGLGNLSAKALVAALKGDF